MNTKKYTFKRIVKQILIVFVVAQGIYFTMVSLNACQNDNEELSVKNIAANQFINSYNLNLTQISSTEIAIDNNGPSTRAYSNNTSTESFLEEKTPVYILYPEDTEEDIKSLYKEVVTTQDLSDLIRLTDAVLQYESYQDNEKYKIEVSEVKII